MIGFQPTFEEMVDEDEASSEDNFEPRQTKRRGKVPGTKQTLWREDSTMEFLQLCLVHNVHIRGLGGSLDNKFDAIAAEMKKKSKFAAVTSSNLQRRYNTLMKVFVDEFRPGDPAVNTSGRLEFGEKDPNSLLLDMWEEREKKGKEKEATKVSEAVRGAQLLRNEAHVAATAGSAAGGCSTALDEMRVAIPTVKGKGVDPTFDFSPNAKRAKLPKTPSTSSTSSYDPIQELKAGILVAIGEKEEVSEDDMDVVFMKRELNFEKTKAEKALLSKRTEVELMELEVR
jgi:hypothetical protein